MTGQLRHPARTAVVWDLLSAALGDLAEQAGRPSLDVIDVGGGSGGFAVPVAEAGHRVLVVDPSPDALATLERRADEAGVADHVRAVQGDAAKLADAVGAEAADAVLCHGVLEVVDEPVVAVREVRAALRPGGLASVLVAQRFAAVLARVVTGHLDDALDAMDSPHGRWRSGDPLPRRYDEPALTALIEGAGLRIRAVHGVRIFTDLVPAEIADEPGARRALLDLEARAAEQPALRPVAGQLHILATTPQHGGGPG